MNDNKNVYYGVGFLDLLLILFIGLKLGKVITWSWVWVLCPFWIQFVIAFIIIIIVAIVGVLANGRSHNE